MDSIYNDAEADFGTAILAINETLEMPGVWPVENLLRAVKRRLYDRGAISMEFLGALSSDKIAPVLQVAYDKDGESRPAPTSEEQAALIRNLEKLQDTLRGFTHDSDYAHYHRIRPIFDSYLQELEKNGGPLGLKPKKEDAYSPEDIAEIRQVNKISEEDVPSSLQGILEVMPKYIQALEGFQYTLSNQPLHEQLGTLLQQYRLLMHASVSDDPVTILSPKGRPSENLGAALHHINETMRQPLAALAQEYSDLPEFIEPLLYLHSHTVDLVTQCVLRAQGRKIDGTEDTGMETPEQLREKFIARALATSAEIRKLPLAEVITPMLDTLEHKLSVGDPINPYFADVFIPQKLFQFIKHHTPEIYQSGDTREQQEDIYKKLTQLYSDLQPLSAFELRDAHFDTIQEMINRHRQIMGRDKCGPMIRSLSRIEFHGAEDLKYGAEMKRDVSGILLHLGTEEDMLPDATGNFLDAASKSLGALRSFRDSQNTTSHLFQLGELIDNYQKVIDALNEAPSQEKNDLRETLYDLNEKLRSPFSNLTQEYYGHPEFLRPLLTLQLQLDAEIHTRLITMREENIRQATTQIDELLGMDSAQPIHAALEEAKIQLEERAGLTQQTHDAFADNSVKALLAVQSGTPDADAAASKDNVITLFPRKSAAQEELTTKLGALRQTLSSLVSPPHFGATRLLQMLSLASGENKDVSPLSPALQGMQFPEQLRKAIPYTQAEGKDEITMQMESNMERLRKFEAVLIPSEQRPFKGMLGELISGYEELIRNIDTEAPLDKTNAIGERLKEPFVALSREYGDEPMFSIPLAALNVLAYRLIHLQRAELEATATNDASSKNADDAPQTNIVPLHSKRAAGVSNSERGRDDRGA